MRNLLDIQFDKAAGSANIDVANVILAVNSTDGQEKWHAGSAAECYLWYHWLALRSLFACQ